MGIKALLRQYVFSAFVILCITVLLCGIIFVRERTQYNIDMTEYERLEVSKVDSGFIISAGERAFALDFKEGIKSGIRN